MAEAGVGIDKNRDVGTGRHDAGLAADLFQSDETVADMPYSTSESCDPACEAHLLGDVNPSSGAERVA